MDPELAVAWENTSGKGKVPPNHSRAALDRHHVVLASDLTCVFYQEDGLGFLDLTKAMDQFRLPSPPPKPFEGAPNTVPTTRGAGRFMLARDSQTARQSIACT